MTIEKLNEIKKETAKNLEIRLGQDGYKVFVVAGKTGIENGSREVLGSMLDELAALAIKDCLITQIGTIGDQDYEPLVQVISPEGKEFLYGKVTPTIGKKIIEDHVLGGKPVTSSLLSKLKEA